MSFLKIRTILLILILWYSIWYFSHNITRGFFGVVEYENTISILQSKKILEAYTYLEKYYYWFHERTETEREDAMIDALTQSLGDKHTSYFNPKDAQEFTESLSGDFEWIGAVIKEHPKGIQIMKVLNNSPADKNWLLKWDIILKIDQTETTGMLAEDAVDIIRGPKWTKVILSILSWSTEKIVTIQREKVIVPSVYSEMMTGTTIGYIEVGFFGEHTTDEFTDSVEKLIEDGAKSLIIDARNNGWWFLDSAVEIVSIFVEEWKLVVATRGIRAEENAEYKTIKRKIQEKNIPIIMLVNNMSASATEIVAWALQDYDRAIILWEKTYGKWSVQEPFILSDGSMMKVTIAKWFTPKDRGIDEKWIDPDVAIWLTDEDYKNIYDRQLEAAKALIVNDIFMWGSIEGVKKDQEKIKKILINNKIISE